MPATTSEVLAEIDRLLEPRRFEDYCVNGLQVPGPELVRTLATGVSANAALFELASEAGADLLIVHHGLFWGSGIREIDSVLAGRLRLLFEANIALAAYHLPLDAHPGIGNNALLADALGADGELTPFATHGGEPIGVVAALPDAGLPVGELVGRVRAATHRDPLSFEFGPDRIRRLAIVSGAGADYLPDAVLAGADALLTGELEERSMALARECSIHLIGAGHHATETFAVSRLGEELARGFQLEHVFLDVPNPV